MTPTTIAAEIGEPQAALNLLPSWKQAMECIPHGLWPAIDPSLIPVRLKACGLAGDAEEPLIAISSKIAGDQCLRTLAWYLQWRVFESPHGGIISSPPTLEHVLGQRLAGAFYLLLALEFAPALERAHRSAGYPETVTRRTIGRVACFESNYRRGRGCPGIYPNQYRWLRTFFSGPCVRLGRFEYQLGTAPENTLAWRNREGGVIMLAADGQQFNEDGLTASDGNGWTAELRYEKDGVIGNPIAPDGRAIQRKICLHASEWEPFLAPAVDILYLHIPEGGNMSFDTCRESFREAKRFFSVHHKDRQPAAILCNTWFLDPRLPEILPESNPARLQRAIYCYPKKPGSHGGLWFVFLDKVGSDPEKLPRDTSFQRALADFLASGGQWHGGAMMIPLEDADDLRQNRYRENFEKSVST